MNTLNKLSKIILNVKDYFIGTGGIISEVPVNPFLLPGEVIMNKKEWIEIDNKEKDIKFIEGRSKNIVNTYEEAKEVMKKITLIEVEKLIDTLEEGTKIIEDNIPINIKDKKPNIGQRCHVYDEGNQQWIYAHWEVSSKVIWDNKDKCYYGIFKEWLREGDRDVYGMQWLAELDKPEEEK